jgi:hypothetical protein
MKFTIAALMVMGILSSGCLNAWQCRDTSWAMQWEQTGIYPVIPFNGTLADFRFEHNWQASQPWKEGRKEIDESTTAIITLQDHAPDRIRFAYTTENDVRPASDDMYKWLEQSFADMGLPHPQYGNATFQGYSGGC